MPKELELKQDYSICKHSLEQLKHDLIFKNASIAILRNALFAIRDSDSGLYGNNLKICNKALDETLDVKGEAYALTRKL